MKKCVKVLIGITGVLAILSLVGLIITGWQVGWRTI